MSAPCRQNFLVRANFPKRKIDKYCFSFFLFFPLSSLFFVVVVVHSYSCIYERKYGIPGKGPIDEPATFEWGQNTHNCDFLPFPTSLPSPASQKFGSEHDFAPSAEEAISCHTAAALRMRMPGAEKSLSPEMPELKSLWP